MKNLDELREWFWLPPIYEQGAKPATQEDLAMAEKRLGLIFPPRYRDIMMLQNGGLSKCDVFESDDYSAPVTEFYPLEAVVDGHLQAAPDDKEEIPDKILVLGSNGHDFMGLDYRESIDNPSVVYREDIDSSIEDVARTFDEFLLGLRDGGY